jgi:hypothetical protein
MEGMEREPSTSGVARSVLTHQEREKEMVFPLSGVSRKYRERIWDILKKCY